MKKKITYNNFEARLAYPINVNVSFNEAIESIYLSWDEVEWAEGYTVWYSYNELEKLVLKLHIARNSYVKKL